MNIEELQEKYKDTGISALSAMVMLEDANIPTQFQVMLDPAQESDWIEQQVYSARKLYKLLEKEIRRWRSFNVNAEQYFQM